MRFFEEESKMQSFVCKDASEEEGDDPEVNWTPESMESEPVLPTELEYLAVRNDNAELNQFLKMF
jgi:hypothetical protein